MALHAGALRQVLHRAASIVKRHLEKSPNLEIPEGDLQLLVDSLKIVNEDMIGMDRILSVIPQHRNESTKAPITFVEIESNKHLYCGIIILPYGQTIPLHDHPNMYGIIKPIYGELKLRSYSLLGRNLQFGLGEKYSALESPEIILNKISKPQVLTPNSLNIHEIEYLSGEKENRYAAFLDLLFPPYNDNVTRPCHYFQKSSPQKVDTQSNETFLIEIDPPDEYISQSIAFKTIFPNVGS